MIKSIPFKPGHLDLMIFTSDFDGDDSIRDDYDQGRVGMTFGETVIDDESRRVFAILNGIQLHSKCMEVCTVISQDAKDRPFEFFRHIKDRLDFYSKELNLKRIQTTIRSGRPHLVKWIKMLGFEYEATLQHFGADGDDYLIYVRFANG